MPMGLIHSRSTVGSSNIHFQFTPKYRREVFKNKKVRDVCDQIYREVAEKLYLSELTVIKHRKNIIKKLGLKNFTEVVSYSYQEGIL